MPPLKVEQLEKWLSAGDKLMKSPIAGLVLAAIATRLPKAGITPTQLVAMQVRLAEAGRRKARAADRAK